MSAPKKRAAAAEVFRQQNMMPKEDAIDDYIANEEQAVQANFYQAQAVTGGVVPVSPPPPAVASYDARLNYAIPQQAPERAKKKSAPLVDALSLFKTSEELQLEKEPLRVRETGFWMWKRVIVPPNAY